MQRGFGFYLVLFSIFIYIVSNLIVWKKIELLVVK